MSERFRPFYGTAGLAITGEANNDAGSFAESPAPTVMQKEEPPGEPDGLFNG
jgi:hypothetical protein